MSQPGLGAMISWLSSNEDSVTAYNGALNKRITAAHLSDDALRLTFEDGTAIELYDDGQSCCEARYLRTDDDLTRAVGSTFVKAEVRDAPAIDDGGECHEVQFLDVQTSAGLFQICAHNEHNGYYGGFSIRARSVTP